MIEIRKRAGGQLAASCRGDQCSGVALTNCSGSRHRIAFIAGKLVLVDHPRESEEKLLAYLKVGGKCRCAEILQAWRQCDFPHIPVKLRAFRKLPRVRRRAIYEGGTHSGNFDEMFELITQFVVKHYRFSQARWSVRQQIVIFGLASPANSLKYAMFAADEQFVLQNREARKAFRYPVCVRPEWLETIYKPGLMSFAAAGPTGDTPKLILDISHGVVVALRQANDFSLHPAEAEIKVRRDGSRFLNWLPWS